MSELLNENSRQGTKEWLEASKNMKISPLEIGHSNTDPVFVVARENPLHREDFNRLVASAAKLKKQAD